MHPPRTLNLLPAVQPLSRADPTAPYLCGEQRAVPCVPPLFLFFFHSNTDLFLFFSHALRLHLSPSPSPALSTSCAALYLPLVPQPPHYLGTGRHAVHSGAFHLLPPLFLITDFFFFFPLSPCKTCILAAHVPVPLCLRSCRHFTVTLPRCCRAAPHCTALRTVTVTSLHPPAPPSSAPTPALPMPTHMCHLHPRRACTCVACADASLPWPSFFVRYVLVSFLFFWLTFPPSSCAFPYPPSPCLHLRPHPAASPVPPAPALSPCLRNTNLTHVCAVSSSRAVHALAYTMDHL